MDESNKAPEEGALPLKYRVVLDPQEDSGADVSDIFEGPLVGLDRLVAQVKVAELKGRGVKAYLLTDPCPLRAEDDPLNWVNRILGNCYFNSYLVRYRLKGPRPHGGGDHDWWEARFSRGAEVIAFVRQSREKYDITLQSDMAAPTDHLRWVGGDGAERNSSDGLLPSGDFVTVNRDWKGSITWRVDRGQFRTKWEADLAKKLGLKGEPRMSVLGSNLEIHWTVGNVTYGSGEGLKPGPEVLEESLSWGHIYKDLGVVRQLSAPAKSWAAGTKTYLFTTEAEARHYATYRLAPGATVFATDSAPTMEMNWRPGEVLYGSSKGLIPLNGDFGTNLIDSVSDAQRDFIVQSWTDGVHHYATKAEAERVAHKSMLAPSKDPVDRAIFWSENDVMYQSGKGQLPPFGSNWHTSAPDPKVPTERLNGWEVNGKVYATKWEAEMVSSRDGGEINPTLSLQNTFLVWEYLHQTYCSVSGLKPPPYGLAKFMVKSGGAGYGMLCDRNLVYPEPKSWVATIGGDPTYLGSKEEADWITAHTSKSFVPSAQEPQHEIHWLNKDGCILRSKKGVTPPYEGVTLGNTVRLVKKGETLEVSYRRSGTSLFATAKEVTCAIDEGLLEDGPIEAVFSSPNTVLNWKERGKSYISGIVGLFPYPGTPVSLKRLSEVTEEDLQLRTSYILIGKSSRQLSALATMEEAEYALRCPTIYPLDKIRVDKVHQRASSVIVWTEGGVEYSSLEGLLPGEGATGVRTYLTTEGVERRHTKKVLSFTSPSGYAYQTEWEADWANGLGAAQASYTMVPTHTLAWTINGQTCSSRNGERPPKGVDTTVTFLKDAPLVNTEFEGDIVKVWVVGPKSLRYRFATEAEAKLFSTTALGGSEVTEERGVVTDQLMWKGSDDKWYGSKKGLLPPPGVVCTYSPVGNDLLYEEELRDVWPFLGANFGYAWEVRKLSHYRDVPEPIKGKATHCLKWEWDGAVFSSHQGLRPQPLCEPVLITDLPPGVISDPAWTVKSYKVLEGTYAGQRFTTREEATRAVGGKRHGTNPKLAPSSEEPTHELVWVEEDSNGSLVCYGSSKGRKPPTAANFATGLLSVTAIRDGVSWAVGGEYFATREEAEYVANFICEDDPPEITNSGCPVKQYLEWVKDGVRYASGKGLLPDETQKGVEIESIQDNTEWGIMTCPESEPIKVVVEGNYVKFMDAKGSLVYYVSDNSLRMLRSLVAFEEGEVDKQVVLFDDLNIMVDDSDGFIEVQCNLDDLTLYLPPSPALLGKEETKDSPSSGVGTFLGLLGGLGLMAGMVGGKKVRAAAPALVAPLSSEAEEPSEEDAGLDLVGRSL